MIYTCKLQKTENQIFSAVQKRNLRNKLRLFEGDPAKIGIDKPSAALYNTRIYFRTAKAPRMETVVSLPLFIKETQEEEYSRRRK